MQNIYNAPDKEKLLPQNLTIKKEMGGGSILMLYFSGEATGMT